MTRSGIRWTDWLGSNLKNMKTIHAMILCQRAAKRFAGRVVAAMIRQGCSGEMMRKRGITESTYFWVLGSGAYARPTPASECATDLIRRYRKDYLFLPNTKLSGPAGGKDENGTNW